jgi:hypothetical protein
MSKTFLFLSLLAAGGAIACYGQAISGDLVGTVQDASGAAVPNAAVVATNTATNTNSSTATNSNGEYRISNLLPGTYSVSAMAQGFNKSTLANVAVNLNQTATANLTLQVGTMTASVDVVEANAAIDTTTAQIENTFTTTQAADLPNTSSGLGVINLSLLQAGVSSSGGVGVGMGPSIGGQRPRNNNFTVEGVDNNSKNVTGPVLTLPNDSVAEFTLLENQFRAEYGHSSGGQFNTIVRSGTNQLHGEVYDYLRNRNLNALDQTFANQGIFSNPRLDQNRLGANVGGPIRKNKLFYFASFEYNPLGRSSTVGSPVYAPTSSGYQTIAGLPGINQTNLKMLETYATSPAVTAGAPSFSVAGASIPTGIIPIAAPNFTNAYFGVMSVDYNISDRDQVRGRYLYNRVDAINTGATLPAFYSTVPVRNQLASIAEYHTFSPSLTNEFRFGYLRSNSNSPVGPQSFPGLDAFPNLQFNNLNLQVGPNPNFPQSTVVNLYQGTDAVTWTHGSHTFKAGTELRKYISPQVFSQRLRGDYEYVNVATYLLDTTPDYLAQRNVGLPKYYGDQIASYSFVQDTWRIRPNLTLDLGARYEYTTVPTGMKAQSLNALASVPGLLDFRAPHADPYGIAPRVGIAYSPGTGGNTVIRAGFGMAYDVLFDNLGVNTVPPEFATTVDVTGAGQPGFLANGGITQAQGLTSLTPAAARRATSSYIPDQLLPYSVNWNVGLQHVFLRDYSIEVRYVGTQGVHQILQQQIDRVSPVTPTNNIPTFLSMPSAATLASLPLTVGQLRAQGSLVPAYAAAGFSSTITSYRPEGHSNYNGLAVQLNRRFARGLQMATAYTWSHNIDNSTAEVASTYLTPRRAENFNDVGAEKASSALDRRHRLTLSLIWDVPFFKNSSNWAMKNLAGNWEFAPIYTYESPEYFTVQSGIDSNLNGDSAPDRTIINPSGTAHTGSDVVGLSATGALVPLTSSTALQNTVVAYMALNPNARYIRAGYGAYANSGRNTEASRPIDNVDLSLLKRFNISERLRTEIGMQALNVFNHPQFTPGSVNNAAAVNTFNSAALSYVTVSSPSFNNPEQAFSSSPRVVQIVAKFIW